MIRPGLGSELPAAHADVSWILGHLALPGHVDGARPALRWIDGERSYADLRRRARGLATAFVAAGLRPGDRVASHLVNRGEIFELYFACAYAGLTLVPVSFRLTSREIGFVLEDSDPRIIVTQAELLPTMREAMTADPARDVSRLIVLDDRASGLEFDELAATDDAALELRYTDVQLILYTSGTTGRPKGVEMRQGSILWCGMQQALYYGIDSSAVTMLTGPMYNTAAMNEQSIPTFLAGGTVTIMPSRGWTPHAMSDLMDEWEVTHALIYPSMIDPMLEADRERSIDLATLRFSLTGGENCPPETMRRFRTRWPHVSLCIAYGSTESGIATLLRDDEIDAHPGSVGRAAGGQLIAIVDPMGGSAPIGAIGPVWTAGPSITSGYWNAPELSDAVLRDGWLDMGDLGRIDDEGYLYIVGRTKDMIISKGQNIYPAEIENTIREHPQVVDVAVVGVPDTEAGEAVCAVVIRSETSDLTESGLVEFVKERIASYKKPKHVIFTSSIARSPSGKVLRPELVENVFEILGISR